MARHIYGYTKVGYRGLCIRCKAPFIGKGDRCPSCADELRRRTTTRRRVAYANRG
jgi:hypothetical protein